MYLQYIQYHITHFLSPMYNNSSTCYPISQFLPAELTNSSQKTSGVWVIHVQINGVPQRCTSYQQTRSDATILDRSHTSPHHPKAWRCAAVHARKKALAERHPLSPTDPIRGANEAANTPQGEGRAGISGLM